MNKDFFECNLDFILKNETKEKCKCLHPTDKQRYSNYYCYTQECYDLANKPDYIIPTWIKNSKCNVDTCQINIDNINISNNTDSKYDLYNNCNKNQKEDINIKITNIHNIFANYYTKYINIIDVFILYGIINIIIYFLSI